MPMNRSSAKWLLVALLAAAAAGLLAGVGLTGSQARAELAGATGSGGRGEVFVVAGQVTKDTYGLYLVDLEFGTICVYQWLPQTRKLRLMAARTYLFDRQLESYNTELPPAEIRKLVAQQKRSAGGGAAP
jgi:hypothetical protein